MPAAAVIRRVQALSGFIGFKGYVGGIFKSVVKACSLTVETAMDTVEILSLSWGKRNLWCSGEMHRYHKEHLLRRQLTGLRTDANGTKAWGANRIRYPGSPRRKRWLLAAGDTLSVAKRKSLSNPPGEYARKSWNSKELTGVRTSGGACGLIRWYARNLTWA